MRQEVIYYGGDYNPEQWDRQTIIEDMHLMKQAGVTYVSVNIFGWKNIQPAAGVYDFTELDWLLDLLHENDIAIDLANGTASPPAWLVKQSPEVLPIDSFGRRLVHGSRQHYCPTSPIYRQAIQELTENVAQRYGSHPGVVMWHINNEYTCHVHQCFCDQCRQGFQAWLEEKYHQIDQLNQAWATTFWSQAYNDWQEIFLPEAMPTFKNPCQELDYKRFVSDMNLELFQIEKKAVLRHSQGIPIMTNLMGLHEHVDGFKWAQEMDVVSWNTYPNPRETLPYAQFLASDLTRSLKKQPFLIMEQATSAVNWRKINKRKVPGQMRLWSYESIAHGADGLMFFQWRQSQGGAEKFHSAMVTHSGKTDTRIYQEVAQLGNELAQLSELVGTDFVANVAIVFDWENWWALELDAKPSAEVRYIRQMMSIYQALREAHISVDFVHPTEDLSAYRLVIVQNLYLVSLENSQKLAQYVEAGGTLLVNFFSGIVNENDSVYLGGYPGAFKELLGIEVEEFSPLYPTETGRISYGGKQYPTMIWEEVVHLRGATALAKYESTDLVGMPAITCNKYGQGQAYYLSTQLDSSGYREVISQLLAEMAYEPIYDFLQTEDPAVSITYRESATAIYGFVLNYSQDKIEIQLKEEALDLLSAEVRSSTVEINASDLAILKFNK
ncbi:beta-galactosidase [Vagococcus sp. BWB3-3]|uniref:Beta-galactosidase n=1 Tax=Vagococcus allomyrinae TaxID=2794353 RepID=A0A940SXG6_9ENTE|nr:beta-galactosidase [Vagococcus allomyrinae]MBP1044310.1 beta-galactosidase [Vagococcus allomyrinae]